MRALSAAGPDLSLEVEDVQPRNSVGADVSALAPHALITPGAEGIVAFPAKNHHADSLVVPRVCERANHLFDGLWTERVTDLGAGDGDARDFAQRFAVGGVELRLVVANVFVSADRFELRFILRTHGFRSFQFARVARTLFRGPRG
jgi:hypothetical protein